MEKVYTIIHTICGHCGKRIDRGKLFQGNHEPNSCICENCVIDYSQIVKEKEERIEKEFIELFSRFKDQETAIEINLMLIEIEKRSPKALKDVRDYVKYTLSKLIEKIDIEPPDILA